MGVGKSVIMLDTSSLLGAPNWSKLKSASITTQQGFGNTSSYTCTENCFVGSKITGAVAPLAQSFTYNLKANGQTFFTYTIDNSNQQSSHSISETIQAYPFKKGDVISLTSNNTTSYVTCNLIILPLG